MAARERSGANDAVTLLRDLFRSDLVRYGLLSFVIGAAITTGVGALVLGNDDVGGGEVSEGHERGIREGERSGFAEAEREGLAAGLADGRAEGARLLRDATTQRGFELGYEHAWNEAVQFAVDRALRKGLGLVDALPEWRALLR